MKQKFAGLELFLSEDFKKTTEEVNLTLEKNYSLYRLLSINNTKH